MLNGVIALQKKKEDKVMNAVPQMDTVFVCPVSEYMKYLKSSSGEDY